MAWCKHCGEEIKSLTRLGIPAIWSHEHGIRCFAPTAAEPGTKEDEDLQILRKVEKGEPTGHTGEVYRTLVTIALVRTVLGLVDRLAQFKEASDG